MAAKTDPTEDTAIDDTATDGRVLRGQRNREAIVDAMVAMFEQGNLRPTAAQVAETAGLSTRSVYHHFDDMKSLALEVTSRSEARMRPPDFTAMSNVALNERICMFVEHRFDRWRQTSAVVRAGLLAEYDSHIVAELLSLGREARIQEIRTVFADAVTGTDEEAVFAALDVVFGYDTWHRLIDVREIEGATAGNLVAKMAHALI